MRQLILMTAGLICAFALGHLWAQNVEPSCNMCPATYVAAEELAEYAFVGRQSGFVDQQVRSIDIGKSKVQIAVAYRGALEERRGRVAEHDLVTEVYVVLSGSGTILTGGDLINKVRRPSDNRAVQFLNGPGNLLGIAENIRPGLIAEGYLVDCNHPVWRRVIVHDADPRGPTPQPPDIPRAPIKPGNFA